MRHFPAFLDLAGRRALLLGEGEIAARKAEPLLRAGAILVRVGRFDPALLHGCAIAIGADAPEADLQALSIEAMRLGIPVNIVDRPALCSFITPALVDRDPITIALSSGGAAPVLARLLRARIELAVPPGFGRLAALADSFKAELRARLPDVTRRRRMLERAFAGRVADLVFAGDELAAREAFAAAMVQGEDVAEPGIVFLVDPGPGPADLLTLRGQRLLGEADVIVHDPDASAAVLDLARRDAERVESVEDAALVAGLARQGRKVIRLTRDGMREAVALRDAGILVEVIPGVA